VLHGLVWLKSHSASPYGDRPARSPPFAPLSGTAPLTRLLLRFNTVLWIAPLVVLVGCAASSNRASSRQQVGPQAKEAGDSRYPGVNTVAYDRNGWQSLLSDHTKIRRTLSHSEMNGLGTVESLTESDDPKVAALITEHAFAMQARMKSGAVVRVWDPVFAELFENYRHISLEVTPTEKGVKITETSAEPEAIALMRSHAMGVNEFVRSGHDSSGEPTARFEAAYPSGVLPVAEVAIGGVPHRFLLGQPDAAQLAALKASGVAAVINFRKPSETQGVDEAEAAQAASLGYCNIPYQGAAELSDDVITASRCALRAAQSRGEAVVLHCRTGNRVGPGWAAFRALDGGIPVEQAINEAKAIGMRDPALEAKTRDYIARHLVAE